MTGSAGLRPQRIIITSLLGFFFVLSSVWAVLITDGQQYSYLAKAFLNGALHFEQMPGVWNDAVFVNGLPYWPLGPFPALLLTPFVWLFETFNGFFLQGYLSPLITIGILATCFFIARREQFSTDDSLFLAFAFVFASVFHAAAFLSTSWYFAHAVAVLLTLLALLELLTRKRWWLIGGLMALVLATRPLAGLGILFFIAWLVFERPHTTHTKAFLKLVVPWLIVFVLLLGYNAVRFGSVWTTGYGQNISPGSTTEEEVQRMGLFNMANIPSNLYFFFIKTPDPFLVPTKNPGPAHLLQPPYVVVQSPGISFFVVGPLFLALGWAAWRKRVVALSLITALIILVPLLCYTATGWTQVGPRYLIDMLPFLYLPLLSAFRESKLPIPAKLVIVASGLVNLYLFWLVFSWR